MEVLNDYWNRTLNSIQKIAITKKDAKMVELIKKILGIPKDIQKDILRHYVKACDLIYDIAFYQYRYLQDLFD